MKTKVSPVNFDKGLFFVPLGGADEIGMNFNLYAYDDQWIAVDFGVSFSDQGGVEVIMPDPTFIEKRRNKLIGLVLTHGHEDHIGAVPYLWQKLKCPIYATPFTANLVKRKLKDAGLQNQVEVNVIPVNGNLKLGPFSIDLINITHSILEPNFLSIGTPAGIIAHTGDWKLDDDPRLGEATDLNAIKKLGEQNVLAMVCDSTNVFEPTASGSEGEVYKGLEKIFKTYTEERLVITCFASNLARVHSIASLASKYGKKCALVGRSLERMTEAARETGYLQDLPEFVPLDKAKKLPRNQIVYITTGSQGESRAALSRIAHGNHKDVHLETGDVVLFSSRRIPGNEKKINELQNILVRHGYEVIFPSKLLKDIKLHVSGHPSQEELKKVYDLIQPRIVIPVHGDALHLQAHKDFAHLIGFETVIVPSNGSAIQLFSGDKYKKSKIVGFVHAGKLVLDGRDVLPEDSLVLRERYRMWHHGTAVVTLVFDEEDELYDEPQITLHGIVNDEDPSRSDRILNVVKKAIISMVDDIPYAKRTRDALVKELVAGAVRRSINQMLHKKPVTDVHIVRSE